MKGLEGGVRDGGRCKIGMKGEGEGEEESEAGEGRSGRSQLDLEVKTRGGEKRNSLAC